MKISILVGTLALTVICGSIESAQAAFVINPVTATDNQHYPGSPATNAIDGLGLSDASIVQTGDPVPAIYPTTTVGSDATAFFHNYSVQSTSNGGPVLGFAVSQFDLGALYSITGGHFWQYTGDKAGFGLRDLVSADIWVSADNITYLPAGILAPGYFEGPDGTLDPGVDFSLTGTFNNVRYVELRNELPLAGGNQFIQVAFDEIRFVGVPEPGSLSLLAVAGLAFVGLRRRIGR